ncbi:MAG: hypothetical protein ABUT39_00230 [Acidobacteriota bacterium]
MPLFLGASRRMSRKPESTSEDVASYFKHLIAEYDALPHGVDRDPRIENLIEKDRSPDACLDWDDLLELELLVLQALPREAIERKQWLIWARYREAAGERDYQEYRHSQPPDARKEPEAARADLAVVLEDLFWRHKLRTIWEEEWKHLVTKIAVGFAGMAAAGLAIVAACGLLDPVLSLRAMLALSAVALAGMTGSLISLLQRLQSVPNEQKRAVSLIGIKYGTALILQSLMTGAIFAFLMLLIFGGGIVEGDLFPKLGWVDGKTFLQGLAGTFEKGGELASLLIWCFLAGFAERLVPDVLDRLASKPSVSLKNGKKEKESVEG